MADSANTPGGGPGPAAGGSQQATAAPRLAVITPYVTDLSFENPMAPQALLPGGPRPEIGVRVNVGVQSLDAERHEVVLTINVEAKAGEQAVFILELAYAGVFGLSNIPAETAQPLLLIECPRLIFPYARRIVSDATRDGGFPPLMIDPIDFVSLYRRRLQQQTEAAAAGTAQA